MDLNKQDNLSESEWNEIVTHAHWTSISYDQVTPIDALNIRKIISFKDEASFLGFEYRGKRGYPKFPLHRFTDGEGFRARVLLNFKHQNEVIPIELRDSKYGVEDIYDHVRKSIFNSTWGKYWGGVGGVVRNYVLNKAKSDRSWAVLSDDFYRRIISEPDELGRARQAIVSYAGVKKGISEAFSNRIVKRVHNKSDPEKTVDKIIAFGSLVYEFSEYFDERELIELIRFSHKFRNEFNMVSAEDKERIVSLARIRKVHTK